MQFNKRKRKIETGRGQKNRSANARGIVLGDGVGWVIGRHKQTLEGDTRLFIRTFITEYIFLCFSILIQVWS